tara:strand:+ start:1144 stop:2214 length:1071 start_codon:yes stop_codon:yes gene_type:complete
MFKSNTTPFFKIDKISLIYLLIIIFIQIIKQDSILIENYYSTFFYKFSSEISLYIFGTFTFSLGDILYLTLPLLLWYILKKENTRRKNLKNIFQFIATLYILFNFQWGLNYYRIPLEEKLLIKKKYELNSLIKVTELFINNTNSIHKRISNSDTLPVILNHKINKELFLESIESIKRLKKENITNGYPFKISIKKSLFSTPLSYMGFNGYINPFTLEAQINTNTPELYLPTTISHEIAHQIGYSAEDEANFIGIMAAIKSKNIFISYSGNVQALRYFLNEIYKIDKTKFDLLIIKVNKGIIKNIKLADKQLKEYNNPLETYFKDFYGMFLKANNQKEGIKSYNMVVSLLVNYYSNQ